jgi:hypothetical protein
VKRVHPQHSCVHCQAPHADLTPETVDGCFVFALVWSVGAACDGPSRAKLDSFLRALIGQHVDPLPSRKDWDLGPGLTIHSPATCPSIPLPQVSHPPNFQNCFQAMCLKFCMCYDQQLCNRLDFLHFLDISCMGLAILSGDYMV